MFEGHRRAPSVSLPSPGTTCSSRAGAHCASSPPPPPPRIVGQSAQASAENCFQNRRSVITVYLYGGLADAASRVTSGNPSPRCPLDSRFSLLPPFVCSTCNRESGVQLNYSTPPATLLFDRNRVGEHLRCPHEKAKEVAAEIKPRSSPRSGQGLAPRGRRRRSPLNLHRRRWSPSSATTRRHLVCPRRPPSMLTSRTRRGRPAVEARTCVLRST